MNFKPHFCRRSWWKAAIISCSLFLLPSLFLFFPMGSLKLILVGSFHFFPNESASNSLFHFFLPIIHPHFWPLLLLKNVSNFPKDNYLECLLKHMDVWVSTLTTCVRISRRQVWLSGQYLQGGNCGPGWLFTMEKFGKTCWAISCKFIFIFASKPTFPRRLLDRARLCGRREDG